RGVASEGDEFYLVGMRGGYGERSKVKSSDFPLETMEAFRLESCRANGAERRFDIKDKSERSFGFKSDKTNLEGGVAVGLYLHPNFGKSETTGPPVKRPFPNTKLL